MEGLTCRQWKPSNVGQWVNRERDVILSEDAVIHGRRVEGEEREKRAWGVVLPKYLISGRRHGGGEQ